MSDNESKVNLATADDAHAEVARLQAEIERLRLTDAEREAVATAAVVCEGIGFDEMPVTLRGLLERTR